MRGPTVEAKEAGVADTTSIGYASQPARNPKWPLVRQPFRAPTTTPFVLRPKLPAPRRLLGEGGMNGKSDGKLQVEVSPPPRRHGPRASLRPPARRACLLGCVCVVGRFDPTNPPIARVTLNYTDHERLLLHCTPGLNRLGRVAFARIEATWIPTWRRRRLRSRAQALPLLLAARATTIDPVGPALD